MINANDQLIEIHTNDGFWKEIAEAMKQIEEDVKNFSYTPTNYDDLELPF